MAGAQVQGHSWQCEARFTKSAKWLFSAAAPLFQLLDQSIDEDALREEHPTHASVISALLNDPSDSLRCVAAHQ